MELIDLFGYLVSYNLGIVGIDVRNKTYREVESITKYLEEHQITEDDEDKDCLEVVLLKSNNILTHTNFYVSHVDGSDIAKQVKVNMKKVTAGKSTIDDRLTGSYT